MQSKSTDSQWAECSGGELEQVVNSLKKRGRLHHQARLASVVAVLVLLTAAVFVGRQFWSANPAFGNISCQEVQHNLKAYVAGEVESDLAGRMRRHLDDCPHCKDRHRRMLEKSSSDRGYSSIAALPSAGN